MSLIFQALRRLGSEMEEGPREGSVPRTVRPRSAVYAARSAGLWWLLAIVLGLAIMQLALKPDLPSRAISALAESGAWLRSPGSTRSAVETSAGSSHTGESESSTAVVGARVVDATLIVAAPTRQKRKPDLIVANVQRGPRLDVRTASVVSSTFVNRGPGSDKPRAVSAKRTANVPSPQEDDRVVTRATFGESLTVSGPPGGSSDLGNSTEKQTNQKLLVVATASTTARRRTVKIKTTSRGNRLQISGLTADLTRAVQVGDPNAVERLLAELGSKAGADSNYVLNMQAYVALARGQYVAVEKFLGKVLARDGSDINAGLNMAVAESRTGRLQQARQRLEQLANVYPDDERIMLMLQSLPQR